jgi:hypothetical protein
MDRVCSVLRCSQVALDPPCWLDHGLPGVRQYDASSGASEQGKTELPLEAAHRLGQ